MTRTPRQPPPTLATRKPAGKAPKRPTARSSAESTNRTRVARIGAAVGVVAAVVGILASLTTVFDWFQAKTTSNVPRPHRFTACCREALQRDVPLGQYLQDNGQPSRGYTHDELAERGLVFTVRVRLKGTVGQRISVNWRMFHSDGRTLQKTSIPRPPAGSPPPPRTTHARSRFGLPTRFTEAATSYGFRCLTRNTSRSISEYVHFAISSVPRIPTR